MKQSLSTTFGSLMLLWYGDCKLFIARDLRNILCMFVLLWIAVQA
jgi:hypothetical protein